MLFETFTDGILLLATLLCTLNAGLLLSFAIVVMPGLKQLDDAEFIRAFQRIDGVIQNGQPLFMVIWLGSAIALLFATLIGSSSIENDNSGWLIVACIAYFVGVQISTIRINIPLNNHLKAVDTAKLDLQQLAQERLNFESRWNRWNKCRTVVAVIVSAMLIAIVGL